MDKRISPGIDAELAALQQRYDALCREFLAGVQGAAADAMLQELQALSDRIVALRQQPTHPPAPKPQLVPLPSETPSPGRAAPEPPTAPRRAAPRPPRRLDRRAEAEKARIAIRDWLARRRSSARPAVATAPESGLAQEIADLKAEAAGQAARLDEVLRTLHAQSAILERLLQTAATADAPLREEMALLRATLEAQQRRTTALAIAVQRLAQWLAARARQ